MPVPFIFALNVHCRFYCGGRISMVAHVLTLVTSTVMPYRLMTIDELHPLLFGCRLALLKLRFVGGTAHQQCQEAQWRVFRWNFREKEEGRRECASRSARVASCRVARVVSCPPCRFFVSRPFIDVHSKSCGDCRRSLVPAFSPLNVASTWRFGSSLL